MPAGGGCRWQLKEEGRSAGVGFRRIQVLPDVTLS